MEQLLLKVNNISKNFGDFKAVSNVSFEVYSGEILGLLGPNGAGKTTVIRMVMGIFQPDSGEIIFDRQQNINKRKIGYLPEERGIYDDTRVLDTILYFAELKGMERKQAKDEAYKWLKRLGLENNAHSKVEELSKGMQQKVQFIISVVHKPTLIVLDEVFSGLDPVNQDLFVDIIRTLSAEGTTILFSSHRMNMVEELCDRIFMINKGQRVLYGGLKQIKDNFAERKVHIVVRENTAIEYLKNDPRIKNINNDNGVLKFNIPSSISPKEFLQSLPVDLDIEELTITKPPLHEIFIAEVKKGHTNER